MVNIHFSKDFASLADLTVTGWRNAGTDAADALRNLEKLCAASGEEFHPDGTPLVEKIYDGRFDGQQALSFIPNVAPAQESTVTPMARVDTPAPVPSRPFSNQIHSVADAPTPAPTPKPLHAEPTSDTIAQQAASSTLPAPNPSATDDVPPTPAPDKK